MRSYGQYCALAKSLEVVGDRWSLLIVRELLLAGACRYVDLLNGLPGIATNLLADRLRDLEEAGVIEREAAPPPIATNLFRLTPRGEQLLPVLRELGRWGGPLLPETVGGHTFRSHWMALPLELYMEDASPEKAPIRIQVNTANEPMVIETIDGQVRARRGTAEHPAAVLEGPVDVVVAVIMGRLPLGEGRKRGLEFKGDKEALRRLRRSQAGLAAAG
jgi:DNA-binding HxlR family transcriptional regulator